MSNIIDFPQTEQSNDTAERVITATAFHMTAEINGESVTFQLTGEEIITTICPICNATVDFYFDEFIDIMQGGDLYGASVYCPECTEKAQRLNAEVDNE